MGISLTTQNVVSALDPTHMAGGASELAVGDRILALDGVDVSNSQAVEKAVRAGPAVEVHTLLVARVVPLRPERTPTLISTRASPMVTPPPEPSPLPWPSPQAGAAAAAHGHKLLGPCPLGARTGYRLALTLTLNLTLTLTL